MTERLRNIETSIEINASREHVWKVLTEPEYVTQWLGCMRYQNTLGHVFYMQQDGLKRQADDVSGATHCRIDTLNESEVFAFSWYMPGTPETRVEIRLTATAPKLTSVTLIHSGWDQFEPEQIRAIRDMLAGGWSSFVLPQLKLAAEKG